MTYGSDPLNYSASSQSRIGISGQDFLATAFGSVLGSAQKSVTRFVSGAIGSFGTPLNLLFKLVPQSWTNRYEKYATGCNQWYYKQKIVSVLNQTRIPLKQEASKVELAKITQRQAKANAGDISIPELEKIQQKIERAVSYFNKPYQEGGFLRRLFRSPLPGKAYIAEGLAEKYKIYLQAKVAAGQRVAANLTYDSAPVIDDLFEVLKLRDAGTTTLPGGALSSAGKRAITQKGGDQNVATASFIAQRDLFETFYNDFKLKTDESNKAIENEIKTLKTAQNEYVKDAGNKAEQDLAAVVQISKEGLGRSTYEPDLIRLFPIGQEDPWETQEYLVAESASDRPINKLNITSVDLLSHLGTAGTRIVKPAYVDRQTGNIRGLQEGEKPEIYVYKVTAKQIVENHSVSNSRRFSSDNRLLFKADQSSSLEVHYGRKEKHSDPENIRTAALFRYNSIALMEHLQKLATAGEIRTLPPEDIKRMLSFLDAVDASDLKSKGEGRYGEDPMYKQARGQFVAYIRPAVIDQIASVATKKALQSVPSKQETMPLFGTLADGFQKGVNSVESLYVNSETKSPAVVATKVARRALVSGKDLPNALEKDCERLQNAAKEFVRATNWAFTSVEAETTRAQKIAFAASQPAIAHLGEFYKRAKIVQLALENQVLKGKITGDHSKLKREIEKCVGAVRAGYDSLQTIGYGWGGTTNALLALKKERSAFEEAEIDANKEFADRFSEYLK